MEAAFGSHLMPVTHRPDVVMMRGAGSYLWDTQGRRYLDFVQGWAVNALGHCPDVVVRALRDQAGALLHAGAAFHTTPQAALADALCAATGMDRAFFTTTGAEANEGAVKLARKWGQRHRAGASHVLTTQDSFHGRTLAMMAASGKPGFAERFPPAIAGFTHVPYGDAGAMARRVGADTVAIMVEPVQGEAGVVVPPHGYLRALREIADAQGILLILDEVQTGVGRCGHFTECAREAVQPDILTLGKGLGGGLPLSALLATEASSCFEPGDQGGTFAGHPLLTAVGQAVVQTVLAPGFLAGVQGRGQRLAAGLAGLPGVVEVRGRGLLWATRLAQPRAEAVRDACFEGGLLVNAPRPDTLRLMPALNVDDQEIDAALSGLRAALAGGHG